MEATGPLQQQKMRKNQDSYLLTAVSINDGKYVHFGLENALNGNSGGLIHCDADFIQFVDFLL